MQPQAHRSLRRRLVLLAVLSLLPVLLIVVFFARYAGEDPVANPHPVTTKPGTTGAPAPTGTTTAVGGPPTRTTETGVAPPTTETTKPALSPTPSLADLDVYRARCREQAGELVKARAVYPAELSMTLGREDTVSTVVTFDKSVAATQVLPHTPGATAVAIGVTCEIEARLVAAEDSFAIAPEGWQSRALFEGQSANWTWFVTPRKGGDHKLILELQPIVKLAGEKDSNLTDAVPITGAYVTDVRVDTPAGDRALSAAGQLRNVLEIVAAILAAVAAIVATLTGLQWRRRRRERPGLLPAAPATVIEELRRLRVERDVDPDEIAAAIGVSRRTLSAMEQGDRVATFRHVHDYASALGVEVMLRVPAQNPSTARASAMTDGEASGSQVGNTDRK